MCGLKEQTSLSLCDFRSPKPLEGQKTCLLLAVARFACSKKSNETIESLPQTLRLMLPIPSMYGIFTYI